MRLILFDTDRWLEIANNIRKHKLRTGLTAFGIFWGIFMLILLLGSGKGLQNGAMQMFKDDAINAAYMWPGKTTIPYKGMQPGRGVTLTVEDIDALAVGMPQIEAISPRANLSGDYTVSYGTMDGTFEVVGVRPSFDKIEKVPIENGRFLNDRDIVEFRKVCVIGPRVRQILFAEEDPVGKNVLIKGHSFKVVGVFGEKGNENDQSRIFVPLETMLRSYAMGNRVRTALMTLKPGTDFEFFKQQAARIVARRHNFDPMDTRAVSFWSREEMYNKFMGLFTGINIFLWFVGIGTLVAGIVGVSNIMLITVRERTKEIGIRKALGATPWWVVSFIVQEALLITFFSGYMGIVAGVFLLELARNNGVEGDFFKNPEVDLRVAIASLVMLTFAGILAGLFPALSAARIKPIEALRYE